MEAAVFVLVSKYPIVHGHNTPRGWRADAQELGIRRNLGPGRYRGGREYPITIVWSESAVESGHTRLARIYKERQDAGEYCSYGDRP